MNEEPVIKLTSEELATLLRSNLSCYMGKNINQELLHEITDQILGSIDYFSNKKDENS